MKTSQRNSLVLFGLAALIGIMLGLVSQAGPLYRMFCVATGLNGTTQNATMEPKLTKERWVTVSFDGNVDQALPWDFGPDQKNVRVKLGDVTKITFHAHNLSNRTIIGRAVDNVQPDKAGLYFDKIQCFCFKNQVLKPGQSIELPVKFFIDPSIVDDRNADDVAHITLSYTFYLAKDPNKGKVDNSLVITDVPAASSE